MNGEKDGIKVHHCRVVSLAPTRGARSSTALQPRSVRQKKVDWLDFTALGISPPQQGSSRKEAAKLSSFKDLPHKFASLLHMLRGYATHLSSFVFESSCVCWKTVRVHAEVKNHLQNQNSNKQLFCLYYYISFYISSVVFATGISNRYILY